ncbi:Uma2 family endonuclease [Streptomyces sp. NPDC005805]|uniref:Uma2 family endonuclease n=1 Tax=Streptomyces sp. NPDC005805 TaxID=3157068 RepID=UPI0033E2F022
MTGRRGRRLFPGTPRELARVVSRVSGLRVGVIGGSMVLTRTDCPTRSETARLLAEELADGPPAGAPVVERAVPMAMPFDADDFAVPDLVLRTSGGRPPVPGRMLSTHEVALAVEVVPRQEKAPEPTQRPAWYAVACVPALLVVDPRYGTWAVHSRPEHGRYRVRRQGAYGEDVVLPEQLRGPVGTARLPLHGAGGPGR